MAFVLFGSSLIKIREELKNLCKRILNQSTLVVTTGDDEDFNSSARTTVCEHRVRALNCNIAVIDRVRIQCRPHAGYVQLARAIFHLGWSLAFACHPFYSFGVVNLPSMGKLGVEKIPSLYFVLCSLLRLIHITPFTQEIIQTRNFIQHPNIRM